MIDEFQSLLKRLEWLTLDEIWHLGDLVDRGPDSGAVIALCREKGIPGITGNHDDSILRLHKRIQAGENPPMNDDKRRTLSQLKPEDIEYLKGLPILKHFEEENLVLTHGGLWPSIPLDRQPRNVIRCQMVHFNKPNDVRWFGPDARGHKSGKSEEENYAEGYRRWTEVYNHPFDVVYGHSVYSQPQIDQNPGFGRTIGVDLGGCFGGALCAAIFDGGEPFFVMVKARKVYLEKGFKVSQE